MNKFVFKKVAELTTEKTELAEVKVDLALVDDIKAYTNGYAKFFTELQGLQKRGDRLKAELNDTISAIYKWGELGKSMADDMASLLVEFEKQAKALGIDAKSSKEFTEGENKFKAYAEAEKAAQRLATSYIKIR